MTATPPASLKLELKRILVEKLKLDRAPESIADDELLFAPEGLGLDSIDALELVLGIEQRFGIQLGNDEVATEALATIDHLARFLVDKKPELAAAAG
jgi:acyl carrier protein